MKMDFRASVLILGVTLLVFGHICAGFLSLGSVDRDKKLAVRNGIKLAHLQACGWSRPMDAGTSVGVALAGEGVGVKPITVPVEDGWGIRLGQAQWNLTPDGPRLAWCETRSHRWERQ